MGIFGWRLAFQFKLPGAAIIGSMVVVGGANALGLVSAEFPAWTKNVLQIVVGAFLGYNVDRNALRCIRSLLKPIALATTWMIASALLIGYLLALLARIDLITALLATSPGGIAEMSAMAMSAQANVALVATLQSFRIITTVSAIPFLARGVTVVRDAPSLKTVSAAPFFPVERAPASRFGWLVWLALGAVGSLLFTRLRVPAAGVIGSMVFVAGVRVLGVNLARPPLTLRTWAQVGLGVLIGSAVDERTLMLLRDEFLLVVLATAATVASGLGLAGVIERTLRVDRQTALLATAPGGLSQMSIIADEVGAHVFIVNMFQLARLICAVLILPLLFHLIVSQ